MKERILADRYRLTEQIGMGGMAIVYKAVDLRTGHNVAIKVLRPEFNEDVEFVSRFQREAEAASKMTHHNIVNLLDVGMDGENRYLVMEYVQGKTLKEVIQERGRLTAPLSCQIAIRILSALEHAHRNGIVHRDIKPQNILVHADGHIKVSDFGIARIADSSTLTKGDMVMGSVHYFSPEQARGEPANATSDIYSTGIVLYEMLTGRVPYDGENPVAVAMQHLHAQPTPIQYLAPDVPPSVIRICMRAMEKNPAMRYQSARDMAADLRVALDERGEHPVNMEDEIAVRQPKPYLRPQEPAAGRKDKGGEKPINRARILWAAVTLLVAAGVIAGLYFGIDAMVNRYTTTVVLPDVTGKTLEEGIKILEDLGVSSISMNEVNNNDYAEGLIIMQVPDANETIHKSVDTVQLAVSLGPKKQKMPNLVGQSSGDAVKNLRNLGVNSITVEKVVSSDYVFDTVISTQPEMGTEVGWDTPVILSVSGGEVNTPSLAEETLQEAEKKIYESSLTLNPQLTYIETDNPLLHGRVAEQKPEAGNRVIQSNPVTLTLYQSRDSVRMTEFDVEAPESNSGVTVKVTMQAVPEGDAADKNENIPNTEFLVTSYVCEPGSDRIRRVPLYYPDSRSYMVNVYFNGELFRTADPLAEDSPFTEAP